MKKDIKYNIFAAVLILVVLYFGIKNLQKEGFAIQWKPDYTNPNKNNAKVTFLPAEETAKFIMSDPDDYIHNLNGWDLIARNVSVEVDYRRRAAAASLDFSEDQKARLIKAAAKADKFFASYKSDCAQTNKYVDISGKDIVAIPWTLALTNGKAYEDGMAHTRANIIFLSTEIDETDKNLTKTLIHEKIHVYQRLYPSQTNAYLANKGYIRWKFRQGVPRMRSNPDVNPWIYIEPTTEKPMMALYVSDNPKNISDVLTAFNDIHYEHPYELMAYTIQKDAMRML
jgi:hypothetical protein